MCRCRLQHKSFLPDLRVIVVVPQPVVRAYLIALVQLLILPCTLNMHGLSSEDGLSSEHDAQSTSTAKLCTSRDTLQAAVGVIELEIPTAVGVIELEIPTHADLHPDLAPLLRL